MIKNLNAFKNWIQENSCYPELNEKIVAKAESHLNEIKYSTGATVSVYYILPSFGTRSGKIETYHFAIDGDNYIA